MAHKTASTSSKRPWHGIRLQDRTEEQIRTSLAEVTPELAPEDIDTWVELWRYARAEKIGIGALAHRTGISQPVLSPGFNGAYADQGGNYREITERIRTFFFRQEQQRLYGGLRAFVTTQLAGTLFHVFDVTRIVRRIQPVEGPEQCGKSRTAEEYTHANNSGRTVRIEISAGTTGVNQFVWDVADALGLPYSIKASEKKIRIRHVLEACDLLIIDEAHLVRAWPLKRRIEFWNYVRTDLYANGKRGIVLLFTNEPGEGSLFVEDLKELKAAGHNIGQLLGRMRNDIINIDHVEDIPPEDVEAFTARYYRPGKAMLRRLHAAATSQHRGHYGMLDDVLKTAWAEAQLAGVALNDEIVGRTLETTGNLMRSRKDLYR